MTELRQRMQEELDCATSPHKPSGPTPQPSLTSPAISISHLISWEPSRCAAINSIC